MDSITEGKNGILVVIISYNSCHLTQECIKSVRSKMTDYCYKIVVVDNASTDGITDWLEELEDILLIKNADNVGFGPACNQAVKVTEDTEYDNYDVFLLNNDTRLTDNAVYFLKKALYSSADVGAVGSVSNYAGNRQQVDVTFDKVEEYLEYGRQNNNERNNIVEERIRLSGFAMLIRREAWNKAGGFD